MHPMRIPATGFALAFALAAPAWAADADRYVDPGALRGIDPAIVRSAGFEAGHPDMWFRRLGTEARRAGRLQEARTWFRRASRFGDKLSQAAYAEMLWEGQGGPADPVAAYIWADLAAERGAPLFVTLRERYWHRLDEAQRERALATGEAVFAEYADDVALPRLERRMRRVANNVTGSRTGHVGRVDVSIGWNGAGQGGGRTGAPRTGTRYYADRYWKPDAYLAWQDDLVLTPQREGRVDVGVPQRVDADDRTRIRSAAPHPL